MRLIQLVILFFLSIYTINCSRVSPEGASGSEFTATIPAGADTGVVGSNGVSGTNGANGASGRSGSSGEDGANGVDGKSGVDCWDLNENGIGDVATEDNTDDGLVNIMDCQAYICRTSAQRNCIPCELDENGECLVIGGEPDCDINTDANCREANPCEETRIPANCPGCHDNIIPPLSTECQNDGIILPSTQYEEITIELTACMSGFHVLKPTLGILSWQTLTGMISGTHTDEDSNAITNDEEVESYDSAFYDIGLAPHCYDTSQNDEYEWLKDDDDDKLSLFNKIKYKISDKDEHIIKEGDWNSPAYNYLDFSDVVRDLNVDYTELYYINLKSITGKDEDGDDFFNFIFLTEDQPTDMANGQTRHYIDTILWDAWDDFDFGPIMTIKFLILYKEMPSIDRDAT